MSTTSPEETDEKRIHVHHEDPSVGDRFSRWTVMSEIYRITQPNGRALKVVQCRCECGNEKEVPFPRLYNGLSKSCGCLSSDMARERSTTHGQSTERYYSTWINIMAKCHKPEARLYKNYGGRGIEVCPEWHDFATFAEWVKASGYQEGYVLERKDTSRNFAPSNCHWQPTKAQRIDRYAHLRYTLDGESKTLADWAQDERCVVTFSAFKTRMARGWDLQRALTSPSDESMNRAVKTNRTYALEALEAQPGLTVREVLAAAVKAGAVFRTNDPEQSLNSSIQDLRQAGLVRSEGSRPTRYYPTGS